MDTFQEMLASLKSAGYRLTAPRRAVARTLAQAQGWLRPEDVHRLGRRYCSTLGLVTVYRTLGLLTELGLAARIHLDDGCHGYALAALSHGHHLVCRSCQQVIEFPGEEDLTGLVERVAERTGFQIDDHMLELLGVCPACQRDPGSPFERA